MRPMCECGTPRKCLFLFKTLPRKGKVVVPAERIELPTFGLQNRCTTAVLRRHDRSRRRRRAAPDGLAPGLFGYQRGQATASAAVPEKVTNNVRHRTATKARLGDCLGKTVKFRSGLSSGPPKRKHP